MREQGQKLYWYINARKNETPPNTKEWKDLTVVETTLYAFVDHTRYDDITLSRKLMDARRYIQAHLAGTMWFSDYRMNYT